MTVDPECSVAISSLSEGECSSTTAPTTSSSPQSLVFIIGGAVATIFIIAIAIVIVIAIITFKLRRYGGIRGVEE